MDSTRDATMLHEKSFEVHVKTMEELKHNVEDYFMPLPGREMRELLKSLIFEE